MILEGWFWINVLGIILDNLSIVQVVLQTISG